MLITHERERPAVRLDDGPRDVETHPEAVRLLGHQGLEEMGFGRGGESRAAILDLQPKIRGLAGGGFSAADVMMGFTLLAARLLAVLDASFPRLGAYLERLERRPAFQRAAEA